MASVNPSKIQRGARIVIIGSGIAGISAAQKLTKAGFNNVRILEATGRSGGRVKTGKFGNNIVEIGASFIHGPSEGNPVFRLARQYGLLDPEALKPENQAMTVEAYALECPNFFTSSGRKLNAEVAEPFQTKCFEILYGKSKDELFPSVGEFFRSKVTDEWKDADELIRSLAYSVACNMLKSQCCMSATRSMDAVGLSAAGLAELLPGLDCTFPKGYEGLIKNLLLELPPATVTYNCPVHCIEWNNMEAQGPVKVECEGGAQLTADHVIVTVSLGFLKKHHSSMFSPPLPLHKLQSIAKQEFGTTNKIYLEFDYPWWDADCEFIYFLWDDEDAMVDQIPDVKSSWIKKLFGFTVLKPTERYGHVLCGWIAGHESEHMETVSEHEVTHKVTELIRRFTGNPSLTPKRVLRTRWSHDPWTCGSYSSPGIGCTAQDRTNLEEPLPNKGSQPLQVLFAGEATHPCFFSTVHGALLSGWREADRLISHYSTEYCVMSEIS